SSFFFSSRRRHTRWPRDWSSDVCSSDLFDRASSGLFLLAVTLSLVLGVFLPALACASLFRLAALGGVRILVGPLVLGLNLIGTWDPPCCAAPVRAAPLCHSRDSQQGSDEECQA